MYVLTIKHCRAAGWKKTIKIFKVNEETYLENVKGFELNVFTLAFQVVHDHFEVLGAANVHRHDAEVLTSKQQLAEKLLNARNKYKMNGVLEQQIKDYGIKREVTKQIYRKLLSSQKNTWARKTKLVLCLSKVNFNFLIKMLGASTF